MFRFFIPIIFIGFAVTLFFSYTQPSFTEIQNVRDQITQIDGPMKHSREEIDTKRQELEAVRESISEENKRKLNWFLPSIDTFDEAGFLNDINNIGLRNGKPLEGITISQMGVGDGAVTTAGEYRKVSCSFSVTMYYSEFKKFLNDLERSVQLLDITSISFSNASDGAESKYQVTVDAYYWVPPSGIGIQG